MDDIDLTEADEAAADLVSWDWGADEEPPRYERLITAILLTLMLAAGAVALALLMAKPAKADQWDYISHLDSNGVSYENIIGVIDLGKSICHELRQGSDIDQILDYLVYEQGYADFEAGTILAGASMNMCPDTKPYVREWLNEE